MKISVIIPTYNASKYIARQLKRLKDQSAEIAEIIVIDSESADDTVKIAEAMGAKCFRIKSADFDHGGTRNIAYGQSAGDIVGFLTQDALPADNLAIARIARPIFENPDVAAVCGRQLPNEETGLFGSHLRLYNYPGKSFTRSIEDRDKYGIKTVFLSDSFAAYRRTDLDAIGGFKKNLLFGEDTHACARLILRGKKVVYRADACVFHSHDYTAIQEFKRYFDIGCFHQSEKWILEQFGGAEREGIKFLESELMYILSHNRLDALLVWPFRIAMKYSGYRLGKKQRILPFWLKSRLSMAPYWWHRQKSKRI